MKVLQARGIEQWAQLCSESFVPLRTAGGGIGFRGSITHVNLGDVGVSHVTSTSSRVYRPEKLIASEPRDDILLSIHLAGTGRVEQSGRCAELTPGAAAVYEADRPYDLRFEAPMSELVLQIPRRRLRMNDSAIRVTSARTIPRAAPSLEVLRHLLTGIVRAGTVSTLNDRLAETTVDLLAATLRPLAGDDSGRNEFSGEAILCSAKVFMERHLNDPEVNVEHVAQHLGVSRRYLELLFAQEHQSPGGYLRHLRLERARQVLAGQRMTVAQAAFATGFQDLSTFGRAFKRSYGVTPREFRRSQNLSMTASALQSHNDVSTKS